MLFVWIWSKKRSDRSDRQLKCSAWTQRGASTQNVINEIWNLIKKNKQMQVVRGEKKIIKCFSSVLSLWWHIRQIQFLFFMCRISKCHINSWLLLFLAARGQFCFIWPFALLPHQHHHLVHSLSLALIHSPSCVPPSAEAPPALCCDRLVRLAFGQAVCSAGRQPAQCVEPRGCTEYLRVSSSFSLSGWLWAYWGHRHHRITQHLLPLTSLQPGELTHTHARTQIALLPVVHTLRRSDQQLHVPPLTHDSICLCGLIPPEELFVFHTVWFLTSVQMADQVHPCLAIFVMLVVACCNTVFLPLFCPFPGTNVHEAKRILTESGLPILAADDLDDAAKKAVAAIKK